MRHPSQLYSVEERVQVWEDEGRMCHYCNRPLPRPGTKAGKRTQFDHIIPHSKGGTLDLANLVVSCKVCNHERGNKDYWDFIVHRLAQAEKQVNRLREILSGKR